MIEEEIKICKNCKYFKRNKKKWQNINYGECNCNKFIYAVCIDEEERKIINNNDALLYEDCEGYSASFEVGENFGCIHFKSKEMKDE